MLLKNAVTAKWDIWLDSVSVIEKNEDNAIRSIRIVREMINFNDILDADM